MRVTLIGFIAAVLLTSTLVLYLNAFTVGSVVRGPSSIQMVIDAFPYTSVLDAYALLARGDRVVLDVGVQGECLWGFNATVVDYNGRGRWGYHTGVVSSNIPTPVFIAPSTSLYRIVLNVTVYSCRDGGSAVSLNIVVETAARHVEASVVLAGILALLAFVVAGRRIFQARSPLLLLLEWEVNSSYLWLVGVVVTVLYALHSLRLDPVFGNILVLYRPLSISNNPGFLVAYAIMVSICVAIVYAYSIERGLERSMDIEPVSRVVRFWVKLGAVLVVTWLPVVLAALSYYAIYAPSLLASPLLIYALVVHATFSLLVTILVAAVSILVSLLTSSTSLSIAALVALWLTLAMDNPVSTILSRMGVNPLEVVKLNDPMSRAWSFVTQPEPFDPVFVSSVLGVSLPILAACLLVYVRREAV